MNWAPADDSIGPSKMNSSTAAFTSSSSASAASSTTASSTARLAAQLRLSEARGRLAGWCPFSDCVLGDSGGHEPPEITYCVVDGDGTLNLQVVNYRYVKKLKDRLRDPAL